MPNKLIYSRLYRWYESSRRELPWRDTNDGYCIWLSEIILQQTRVAQGLDYYLRFLRRWPDIVSLASADESEVLREWQGLGYYSRARNLHKAARQIVESQRSEVESGAQSGYLFPRSYEEIRALPGVGDYTAGAIASFAYNLPYPAMDGNVYRVVARLLDIDEPFDSTSGKKRFRKEIERLLDKENPRLFNSAIMEFGALQCTPSLVLGEPYSGESKCGMCPLGEFCLANIHHTADLLPVRKSRPQIKDRWIDYHIYLLSPLSWGTDADKQPVFCPLPLAKTDMKSLMTLIRRRENPKDIWYHLYEFPSEERSDSGNGLAAKAVCSFTHVLSHQRIHARFFVHPMHKLPSIDGAIAIRWEELDEYALSRLTLRALEQL